MEEIKIIDNPLGIKVYATEHKKLSKTEYSLLVAFFADRTDKLFAINNGQEKSFNEDTACIKPSARSIVTTPTFRLQSRR